MANEPSKAIGAPKMWDSMACFLPVFIVVMALLLVGMILLKDYLA